DVQGCSWLRDLWLQRCFADIRIPLDGRLKLQKREIELICHAGGEHWMRTCRTEDLSLRFAAVSCGDIPKATSRRAGIRLQVIWTHGDHMIIGQHLILSDQEASTYGVSRRDFNAADRCGALHAPLKEAHIEVFGLMLKKTLVLDIICGRL